MTSYDLAQLLFQELGYLESADFTLSADTSLDAASLSRRLRPIPDVAAVYWINNIPVAYFSRLEAADPYALWQLHRRVWNQSKAPLLYVILPQEIRIYNAYAEPASRIEKLDDAGRLLRHLSQLTHLEKAREAIRNELVDRQYDRLHLDTGVFWTTEDGRQIHQHTRADQRLLRRMDRVRERLIQLDVTPNIAYAVLGRSILVRYLEDRGVLHTEQMSRLTNGRASNYVEALLDLETTYLLFNRLSQQFDGDLFPVLDTEREMIGKEHLLLLRAFLLGSEIDSDRAYQPSFWPYDFRYIPIELISGIYDTFLHPKERRHAGTYYTPLPLVDFMLDQTMPMETLSPDTTVLDPACGSGIFLVRAYQRLVSAWRRQYGKYPNPEQLVDILQKNIFGTGHWRKSL